MHGCHTEVFHAAAYDAWVAYQTTEKAVTDMLSRMPTLLDYQTEQLQAMQDYLGGHGGLSRVDVASLLQHEPRILSYSLAGVLSDLHHALLCMCRQHLPASV